MAEAQVRSPTFYTGRKLLVAAWIVEIFAALVGLSIAAMTGYSILEELQAGSGLTIGSIYTNVLLGALPFLMVSVVELTKIPLAIAFYNSAAVLWRGLFGISLVFLMFITFETAMNGFERNFNNLTYTIQQKKRELLGIEEEVSNLRHQQENRSNLTAEGVRATFRAQAEQLRQSRQAELAAIDKLIQDKHAISNSSLPSNSPDIANKQIDELRAEHQRAMEALERDYKGAVDRLERETRAERTTLEQQISQFREQLQDLARQEEKEQSNAGFLDSKSAIAERYERRRAPIVSQQKTATERLNSISAAPHLEQARTEYNRSVAEKVRAFEARLDQLQRARNDSANKVAERESIARRGLETELKGLEAQKRAILQKFEQLEAENERQLQARLGESNENAHVLAGMTAGVEQLEKKRAELRDFINQKVADNQVYRITALWTGRDNAADIGRDELRVTALVWFGSLAAIVAATGTIIAFAGLVLMYPRARRPNSPISLTHAVNRLAAYAKIFARQRRKFARRVETRVVEVVKEVPVEKIVFRDVPREIVRRELVHVPLYTADPQLLAQQKEHA